MRSVAWVVAASLLGACFMARQDARIRPGGQVGVTAAVMLTPDAETSNPDPGLNDLPPRNDAADVRGITDLTVAYGAKRVEFRWHIPLVRWQAGKDFPFEETTVDGVVILMSIELYILVARDGPFSFGVGVESTRGAHAVATYELTPRDAVSVTARACYEGSESDGRRAALFQGQLSYGRALDAKHDLRVFVSSLTQTGEAEGWPVRAHSNDYDSTGRSRVHADWIGMFGASIDWH